MSLTCMFLFLVRIATTSSSETPSSSHHLSPALHIIPLFGVFVIYAMLYGRTCISKLPMMLLRDVLSSSVETRVLQNAGTSPVYMSSKILKKSFHPWNSKTSNTSGSVVKFSKLKLLPLVMGLLKKFLWKLSYISSSS